LPLGLLLRGLAPLRSFLPAGTVSQAFPQVTDLFLVLALQFGGRLQLGTRDLPVEVIPFKLEQEVVVLVEQLQVPLALVILLWLAWLGG